MSARKLASKFAFKAAAVLVGLVVVPAAGILLSRATGDKDTLAASASASAATIAAAQGPENDFVGVLLPPKMASLSPRADGRVLTIAARAGQIVKQGDVLVTFDPRERQHDLAMANAELLMSQAEAGAAGSDMRAARARAARRNATVDVGGGQKVALVSGEEASQAHFEAQGAASRAAQASARIAQQKAKVEQLKLSLEETELRAPFDGVVTAVNFETGMTAHTGDLVVRVVGGNGLRARFAIPEDGAALMKRRRARINLDGRVLFANIDQVGFEVEPASRMFLVEGVVELAQGTADIETKALAGRAVRASMLPEGG